MAATLKLEIVTPEEKIYSEDVSMVTLPGSEGELGVYPNHVPVLTALKPGELRIGQLVNGLTGDIVSDAIRISCLDHEALARL